MLRDYQLLSLDLIREAFNRTKKVLLHAATGSGKTATFCEIIALTEKRQKHAIVVVRGRKLVNQASQRLKREGVLHGVWMSGHRDWAPHRSIQVCSIDTLISRKNKIPWPSADVVVIDEAHMASSDGYKKLAEHYKDAYFVSVTATPYTDKPITHVAEEVIHPITVEELIDRGYLVNARYFAPSSPDLHGVRITAGDYNQKQLSVAVGKTKLVGDIVSQWKKLGEYRPTLCFCVSIAHSQMVAESFKNAGIPALALDQGDDDETRDDAIASLVRGEIKILCNVNIFSTGVDIPELSCIILARPTKSLCLHIQQLGRGTRPHSTKQNFIVLDHAGNLLNHGLITTEHEAVLDGKKKQSAAGVRTCKNCYGVFDVKAWLPSQPCPSCGALPVSAGGATRTIESVEGELSEMKTPAPRYASTDQRNQALKLACLLASNRLDEIKLGHNYKEWSAFYKATTDPRVRPFLTKEEFMPIFKGILRKYGYPH